MQAEVAAVNKKVRIVVGLVGREVGARMVLAVHMATLWPHARVRLT